MASDSAIKLGVFGIPCEPGGVRAGTISEDYTQKIVFLGSTLNSVLMMLTLPEEKMASILPECSTTMKRGTLSVRALASLIGRMSAANALQGVTEPHEEHDLNLQDLPLIQLSGDLRSSSQAGSVLVTRGRRWNGRSVTLRFKVHSIASVSLAGEEHKPYR